MSWSSCGRLWQWIMYRPSVVESPAVPNRMIARIVSFSPTYATSFGPCS